MFFCSLPTAATYVCIYILDRWMMAAGQMMNIETLGNAQDIDELILRNTTRIVFPSA